MKIFGRRVVLAGMICLLAAAMLALAACAQPNSSASSSASSSSSSEATPSKRVTTDAGYSLARAGMLSVATCANYVPMQYWNFGEIKGFDMAIIKEVAKRLNLGTDVKDVPFDELISYVDQGKKYDCAISAIPITDDRKERAAFSNPYLDRNYSLVVLADSPIANKGDLKGKPVAAQVASFGEEWVQANLKDSPYTPFQEPQDMFEALLGGKISAFVVDEPSALYGIANDYAKKCKVIEVIPTGTKYGIMVASNNVELANAINKALDDMKADGTYEKIYTEWFGKDAAKK